VTLYWCMESEWSSRRIGAGKSIGEYIRIESISYHDPCCLHQTVRYPFSAAYLTTVETSILSLSHAFR
jgi:hypothetical protein